MAPLTIDAFGEAATVAEIFSIVDERSVRRSNPWICARPRLSPLAPSSHRARALVWRAARRQFDEDLMERWERRNADIDRVVEHQFLVHCEVNENEKDKEGEKTLLWLTVPELFNVPGMDRESFDDMFETFEKVREERRNDALNGFEE